MDPSASLSAPHAIRKMIKDGDYTGPTKGFVPGFTQCNVIILPHSEAYSFFRFCESNQSVCKLIIPPSEPGNFNFDTLGKDIDIRYHLPKYQILKHGQLVQECHNIEEHWRDDLVTFAFASYLSFDNLLAQYGINPPSANPTTPLPLYISNLSCNSVDKYEANQILAMRPLTKLNLISAIQAATLSRLPYALPLHFGEPNEVGIKDLSKPNFGEPLTCKEGQLPVFWGSSLTAQLAIAKAAPEFCIMNSPHHLLVTDRQDLELAVTK
ncbi:DUF1445 domain-containing protein [Pseudoalteromonas piscicida]|uniref:DUF1445 domain-containing protein n=1 Tax=Pseudoalteromonas piscicida TaxID=43662 RepID=A0ABM6NL08_PSEO7|nr:DUF1445 domain-containing protein [Pseudoalteromonas piscicida]ATD09466.1 hypothetical protein PPIS_b0275 [Pseudoalteromonas piscicida]WPU31399.1 DUF1445 domain-containing protein [Pseudoalteromonas piscicida]